MIVGYARTSTVDQQAGLDAQIRDLKAAGAEKLFTEQVSSVAQRNRLRECLGYVRAGDRVVCTTPDRLARSTKDLLSIVDDLTQRGVSLLILSMGGRQLDTGNPTSRLMLTILGAVAEWERQVMLERQKEGVAAAKAAGLYKGRKPTAMAKADQVRAMAADGMTRDAISQELCIGVASVYRILRASS